MMLEHFRHARLETNGMMINLHHGDSGPPLLLLHGYPQIHVMWHTVVGELAKHFKS
jgi:haloacetate dehalogenase